MWSERNSSSPGSATRSLQMRRVGVFWVPRVWELSLHCLSSEAAAGPPYLQPKGILAGSSALKRGLA